MRSTSSMDMMGAYIRSAGSLVRFQPMRISPTMRSSILATREPTTSLVAGVPLLA